jgi:ABC-type cobalamin transport system permease subunit
MTSEQRVKKQVKRRHKILMYLLALAVIGIIISVTTGFHWISIIALVIIMGYFFLWPVRVGLEAAESAKETMQEQAKKKSL